MTVQRVSANAHAPGLALSHMMQLQVPEAHTGWHAVPAYSQHSLPCTGCVDCPQGMSTACRPAAMSAAPDNTARPRQHPAGGLLLQTETTAYLPSQSSAPGGGRRAQRRPCACRPQSCCALLYLQPPIGGLRVPSLGLALRWGRHGQLCVLAAQSWAGTRPCDPLKG